MYNYRLNSRVFAMICTVSGIIFFVLPGWKLFGRGLVIQFTDFLVFETSADWNSLTILQETDHGYEAFLAPMSRLSYAAQLLSTFVLGKSNASILWLFGPIVGCFLMCLWLLSKVSNDRLLNILLSFLLTVNPSTLEYLVIWPTAVFFAIPVFLALVLTLGSFPNFQTHWRLLALGVGLQVAPYFFVLSFFLLLSTIFIRREWEQWRNWLYALALSVCLASDWIASSLLAAVNNASQNLLPGTDGLLDGMMKRVNPITVSLGLQYPMPELDGLSRTDSGSVVWLIIISLLVIPNGTGNRDRRSHQTILAMFSLTFLALLFSMGPTSSLTGTLWTWVVTNAPGAKMLRTYSRVFQIAPSLVVGIYLKGKSLHTQHSLSMSWFLKGMLMIFVIVFYYLYIQGIKSGVRYYFPTSGYEVWNNKLASDRVDYSVLFLPNSAYESIVGLSRLADSQDSFLNTGYYARMILSAPVLLNTVAFPSFGVHNNSVNQLLRFDNSYHFDSPEFRDALHLLSVRYVAVRRTSYTPATDIQLFERQAAELTNSLSLSSDFKLIDHSEVGDLWEYCCWSPRASVSSGAVIRRSKSFYQWTPDPNDETLAEFVLRLKSSNFWVVVYLRQNRTTTDIFGESCTNAIYQYSICTLLPASSSGDASNIWFLPNPSSVYSAVWLLYWPDYGLYGVVLISVLTARWIWVRIERSPSG